MRQKSYSEPARCVAGISIARRPCHKYARYAASRSVALVLTALIATVVRSSQAVVFVGIAMTMVQALDGVIGALAREPSRTYGPFALAVVNALARGGHATPTVLRAGR